MSILMNINTKKTHTSEVGNRDWTATLQQFAKDGSGLKARSLVSRKQPLGIFPVPMAGVDYIQAVGESRCHRQLRPSKRQTVIRPLRPSDLHWLDVSYRKADALCTIRAESNLELAQRRNYSPLLFITLQELNDVAVVLEMHQPFYCARKISP